MSSGLIGGLIGLGVALFDYGLIGSIMGRLREGRQKPATLKALNFARVVPLVAFPAAGYWIGSTQF